MTNGNDQKKSQPNQKRDNNRPRGGDRNNGRPRPKTVEMELFFTEQTYRGAGSESSTPVAILQDGTRIFPRSPRFNPQVSTDADFERNTLKMYTCLVRFTEGKDVADCWPKVWQTLSPDEFLPEEEWRKAIVVPLTFSVDKRDERGRPKAFHKGKVVFVDRDSEVTLNQSRLYMLSYGGRVAYAHALPHAAGTSGGSSNALVHQLGEKLGELSLEGLKFVVVKVAQNKSGVAMPKSEKDLVIKQSYKSVYELLGIASDATEQEVKSAYRAKSRIVHPDAVLPKLGKHATVKDQMNITFFWEAVQKAYESALAVIDRAKGKKAPVQAPVSEKVETEASAPVETALLVETPAAITDSAPAEEVAAQVETAPAVETPVAPTPAVEAPKALTQEEELAAAAVLANSSLEEFKAKAPSFQKHYLQQVRRGNAFNRPAPAKSSGGKKSPKPQKVVKSLADIGKVLENGEE